MSKRKNRIEKEKLELLIEDIGRTQKDINLRIPAIIILFP